MVDISRIKVGDTVTVEFTVTGIEHTILGWGTISEGSGWVRVKDVVGHTPAPIDIQVGTKFKGDDFAIYEVFGIHGNGIAVFQGTKTALWQREFVENRIRKYGPVE